MRLIIGADVGRLGELAQNVLLNKTYGNHNKFRKTKYVKAIRFHDRSEGKRPCIVSPYGAVPLIQRPSEAVG